MHTPVLQERAPMPAVVERIDADAFLEMQYLPEFRDKEYELIQGEMIEMPAPAWGHGRYAGRIFARLLDYEEKTDLGAASIEVGVRLRV